MRGILKKATRLYGNGKYSEVIRLLEPQVFRFRESPNYYYLLGMACLRTGDFGGAHSYLRRCIDLHDSPEENLRPLLAMAVVHLRRLENDKALLLWLRVLDHDKKNAYANRGLRFLKKNPDPSEIDELFDSGRFKKFLPSDLSIRRFFPVAITALAIVFLCFLGIFAFNAYEKWNGRMRRDFSPIELDPERRVYEDGGVYRYLLSDKEIKETFDKAQKYMLKYQDNLARIEINRLLHSNASNYIKEQARLLNSSVRELTFSTLKESADFQTVTEDPVLYDGCYIRWKGKASNIRIGEDAIRFDFLVGYHDQKVLLGIVPVSLNFAAKINEQFPIELLGQIVLFQNDETKPASFMIRGISIHQLAPTSE